MKKTYSKNPLLVKQERAALRHRYPLLCGFRNFLFNALPFALIWLVSSINMLAAALAAFFMMLLHCLMENPNSEPPEDLSEPYDGKLQGKSEH